MSLKRKVVNLEATVKEDTDYIASRALSMLECLPRRGPLKLRLWISCSGSVLKTAVDIDGSLSLARVAEEIAEAFGKHGANCIVTYCGTDGGTVVIDSEECFKTFVQDGMSPNGLHYLTATFSSVETDRWMTLPTATRFGRALDPVLVDVLQQCSFTEQTAYHSALIANNLLDMAAVLAATEKELLEYGFKRGHVRYLQRLLKHSSAT